MIEFAASTALRELETALSATSKPSVTSVRFLAESFKQTCGLSFYFLDDFVK